jgi:SOS-response transcriptional repressor LexA
MVFTGDNTCKGQGDVAIEWIDLSPLLMPRPSSTFFCRVNGDSMKDERLQDGDIVIVV